MSLQGKYAWALQTAQGKFNGGTEERDGKLYWRGTVATEAEKNEIWAAIKTIPEWEREIVADIRVTGGQAPAPGPVGPAARPEPKTYTVKPGDTLSKIAKMTLGDANAYMKIFELNRDQLSNPDEIKPGQVLKIA